MKSKLPPGLDKTVIVEKEPSVMHPERRTKKNSHRFDDEADYLANTVDGNLWAADDVTRDTGKRLNNKNDREHYENFVYGLLYHNDMVDKEGRILHKLYFEWDDRFENVRIYISPAPTQTSFGIDPQRPPIPPPPEANS